MILQQSREACGAGMVLGDIQAISQQVERDGVMRSGETQVWWRVDGEGDALPRGQ
jgi:hypothetical protein